MAETYPLSLPTVGEFTGVQFSRVPMQATDLNKETRQRDVFEHAGDTWRVSAAINAKTKDAADPWINFFMRLDGMVGTFLMGDPFRSTPKGTPLGLPVISGAGQLGKEIQTAGWALESADLLKAGDNVQFGTGLNARLHRVLDEISTDDTAGGPALLNVRPRVSIAQADQTEIITTNPMGLFRMTANNFASWNEERRKYTSGLTFTAESVV